MFRPPLPNDSVNVVNGGRVGLVGNETSRTGKLSTHSLLSLDHYLFFNVNIEQERKGLLHDVAGVRLRIVLLDFQVICFGSQHGQYLFHLLADHSAKY